MDSQIPSMTEAVSSEQQVLQDAASALRNDSIPWCEVLTVKYDPAKGDGEAVNAVTVLAALSMMSAEHGTALAPALEGAKVLIEVARTVANLREDILETIVYCVAILRCIIEVAKNSSLPPPLREVLKELQADMEEVAQLCGRFGSRGWRLWQLLWNSGDQQMLDKISKRLKDKVKIIARNVVLHTLNLSSSQAHQELRVRGEVPKVPSTYVRRDADNSVVEDLVDPGRPASSCHCVWGMGGAGKSLLAASVVHDERTLSSFKEGVFWITVGKTGTKDRVVALLESLSMMFEKTSSGRTYQWPSYFHGADDATYHLKQARGNSRCLVVLDDVWYEEVVHSFVATGFHLLVTTRKHEVVRRGWAGTFTEVQDMTEEEALDLLGAASQAGGPLPEHEARSVAEMCGRLPLALSMAGRLGKDNPLQSSWWRSVLDKLQDKRRMLKHEKGSENGVLFPVIDATFDALPRRQKELFRLMVVISAGVQLTTKMMASLWEMAEEDIESHVEILADYSLLHETAGAYRLHDLTHEYLHLHTAMIPGTVSLATSRQVRFLLEPQILQAYMSEGKESFSGLYELVKLWTTVSKLDRSRRIWDYVNGSQEASDKTYMRNVGKLMIMMGEAANSDIAFRRVVIEEEANNNSTGISFALANLGRSLVAQGKYEEAELVYRQAMAISETLFGTEHPSCFSDLFHLAAVLEKQGQYEEAESLLRRAIAVVETNLGTGHPSYSSYLINLGELLIEQGKYEEAELTLGRAIDITETTLGMDRPEFSYHLTSLALVLEKQGKYDAAESLLRRATAVVETTLGNHHPEYSIQLNNLAVMLEQKGKYEEAEQLHRHAIVIAETTLGKDHPNSLIHLNNLAVLLMKQDKFGEAEPLCRRAMAVAEVTMGNQHPEYSMCLNNLAQSLSELDKFEEAELMSRRALAITKSTMGVDHPSLSEKLGNLGSLLYKQGKFDEAEPLLRRAMAITEGKLGTDHPSYSIHLNNLAVVLKEQGKFEEAESLYRRAMVVAESILGAAHPENSTHLRNLAGLLGQQGKFEEAELLFRRAITIMQNALGVDHPLYFKELHRLGSLLLKQGKYEEAESLYRRTMTITEATLGTIHPSYSIHLSNIAILLEKQGKYKEAEPLFRRAMAITETTLGTDHPEYSIRLLILARLLFKQGKFEEVEELRLNAPGVLD